MNLFSVNGGLLNGGSRLFTVAASAVVACAATVVAVGDRIQDALASSSAQTSVVAAATYTHRSSAQLVGGSSGLKAVAGHQRSANAQIAAGASVRAFVLRALDASAFVKASADISAIPASVLGRADVQPSAEVAVVATKVQPGRSDKLPASAVIDSAPFVTRSAHAELVSAAASLYIETAINRVDEAYSQLHGGATLLAADSGLVFRPASASMEATGRCSASATHIQPSKSDALAVGSVIDTDTHLIRFGASLIAGDAVVRVDSVRIKRPTVYAVAMVGVEVDSQVNHGSAQSLIAPTSDVKALSVRYARVAALVPVEAGVWASGVRCVQPQVFGGASFAAVDAVARRRVFAATSPAVSVAAVQAVADTTVREAVVVLPVHADVTAVAVRDAGVTAEVLCLSAGSVDSVRVVMGRSWVEVAAATQADAVRYALATAADATSDVSVYAVPDMVVREASASLVAASDVQAQAQRQAMGQATVVGFADFDAAGTRQAVGFAYAYPDAQAVFGATRVVLGEANFTPWTTLIASLNATVRDAAAFLGGCSGGVVVAAGRETFADAALLVSVNVASGATRTAFAGTVLSVTAGVEADAIRVVAANAQDCTSSASLTAITNQTQRYGTVAVVADSWVRAIGTRQTNSSSRGYFNMEFHGDAVRTACPVLDVRCTAVVEPDATRVAFGAAVSAARAFFVSVPDVTIRVGQAHALGGVSVSTNPTATRHSTAHLDVGGAIQVQALRSQAGASEIQVIAHMQADCVANPFSTDPAERTFVRTATATTFTRSATLTEFRRTA